MAEALSDRNYIPVVKELLSAIPEEEQYRVFSSPDAGISPEFMGFVTYYKPFADLIPEDWTVIDFGAAHNPQAYLFKNHKRYIAVEPEMDIEMFKPDNCDIYRCTTKEFIEEHLGELASDPKVFAICSYVPNWHGQDSIEMVKSHFRCVFTYFPVH